MEVGLVWIIRGDVKVANGITLLEKEVERGSDRAVAIIAGSIVERQIADFLSRTIQDTGDIWKTRSNLSGPFGSFSVKIDLLFMFRLITRDAYNDLCQMKDIRNAFAHRLEMEDFNTRSILDKTMNMKLVESYVVNLRDRTEKTASQNHWLLGEEGAEKELEEPQRSRRR